MSGQAAVQVTGRAVHTTANTPYVPSTLCYLKDGTSVNILRSKLRWLFVMQITLRSLSY